ncbi:MAG: hypothetical protein HY401_04995 [Elusimicrobia bacterium]|nr:hypothetical protein [Elusimicrobiota bacterium]
MKKAARILTIFLGVTVSLSAGELSHSKTNFFNMSKNVGEKFGENSKIREKSRWAWNVGLSGYGPAHSDFAFGNINPDGGSDLSMNLNGRLVYGINKPIAPFFEVNTMRPTYATWRDDGKIQLTRYNNPIYLGLRASLGKLPFEVIAGGGPVRTINQVHKSRDPYPGSYVSDGGSWSLGTKAGLKALFVNEKDFKAALEFSWNRFFNFDRPERSRNVFLFGMNADMGDGVF